MTIHQPKSLKSIAAKLASVQITNSPVCTLDKVTKCLPMSIQTAIALHLQAKNLVEFIILHGALPKLRLHFDNVNQFQEFILHFFVQLENEENSSETQCDLKKQFVYLQKSIESKMVFELNDEYDFVPVNKIVFDWAVRSLGYTHPILPQRLETKCLEDDFFSLKFGGRANLDQFPIPNISEFEPKIKTRLENHSNCPQEEIIFEEFPIGPRQRIQNKRFDYENVIDGFFLRLCCIILCIRKSALHEGLVYVVELLCAPKFQNVPFLERYQIHIWGNLSTILAQLNVNSGVVFSCLDNVEQLVRFESDKLDYFRYRQQASFHLGWTLDENCMFEILFKKMSTSSMFYYQAIQCHVQTVLDYVEDLVLEIDVCLRIGANAESDEKEKKANDLIKQLRVVLHKTFSKSDAEYFTCEGSKFNFAILDLYELMVKLVTGNLSILSQNDVDKLIQKIGNELEYSDSHLDYFLTHYNNMNQTSFFLSEIDNFKNQFDRESNSSNNVIFASVYVTNALLLKFLDRNNHSATHFMHEAKKLYEKIQHPRTKLIHDFIFCKAQQDRSYKMQCETFVVEKNVTIQTILKDQKLCQMVNCGVKSLIQFDTCDNRTFNV